MDPVARRFMWRVLSSLSATGGGKTSLILTTHSMEEAENLCGRIGVMVGGGLSCLGSSTHLKNTFGQGLELEVKIPQPDSTAVAEELAASLDNALIDAFSGCCKLLERPSATTCRYRVAGRGVALAATFRKLEAMKMEGLVAEYSVGQTTLEQVFNQFASSQHNPEVG